MNAPVAFAGGSARLLLLVTLTACAPPPEPPRRATVDWRTAPSILELASSHSNAALPSVSEDEQSEVIELLDTIGLGGRVGQRAAVRIADLEAATRDVHMLRIVEGRAATLPVRRLAYAYLRDQGTVGCVPRLTLRLKYEKDLWSAVCIADTLLRHGSGAGLDALENLLQQESDDPDLAQARAYAAEVLSRLPDWPDQPLPDDFPGRWQHLQRVYALWQQERRLAPDEQQVATFAPSLEAELWRFLTAFLSQPLRPVDDARFVLVRQRMASVPLLLAASRVSERYVREHSLQTLAWIGPPVGAWCRVHQVDLAEELQQALSDPALQVRALEALGASGLRSSADQVASFLLAPSFELRTAAAEALLRCGTASQLPLVIRALDDPNFPRLSAEARFSLWSLRMHLQPELELEYPVALWDSLPEAERARRQRWLDQRP